MTPVIRVGGSMSHDNNKLKDVLNPTGCDA